MTTSVDILFKEFPAPSRASDRISRPDTSPVGSDHGQDRSSVSRQDDDRRYEKPFTEHLDDQDVDGKQPEYSKSENKPDYSNSDDHKNKNVVQNSDDVAAATVSKPAADKAVEVSEDEVESAIEQNEKNPVDVVAVNTEDTSSRPKKTVQTVTTKDLLIAEVAPEKAVVSNTENPVIGSANNKTITDPETNVPAVSVVKGLVADKSEAPQGNENQAGVKGIQSADLNNNDSAKQHSPVFTGTATTAPTVPETAHQATAKSTPYVEGETQNQAPFAIPAKITTNADSATQQTSPKISEAGIPEPSPDTLNKDTTINEQVTAPQKTTVAETEPQKSGVIISATAIKDEIDRTPIMEKPVAQPETVAVESEKTLPFAVLQSHNNAQKTSTTKKGGASVAPETNIKATNTSAAGAANTQSSVATPSLLSTTKSDIQLDLGMAGQKLDTLLPPPVAPNGQTALSTGGLLAVQDVSFQKTVSNLGATVKTDTPLDAKMINEQITVAINKNVVKGLNNFSIRLHPVELGQVDVRLEFMADGRMHAAMTVENEKTLTMLQRDQGTLEKALQDAGINLSNKNMDFSLMKQSDQNKGQKFAGFNGSADNENSQNEMSNVASMQEVRMGYSNQTIDISV